VDVDLLDLGALGKPRFCAVIDAIAPDAETLTEIEPRSTVAVGGAGVEVPQAATGGP